MVSLHNTICRKKIVTNVQLYSKSLQNAIIGKYYYLFDHHLYEAIS